MQLAIPAPGISRRVLLRRLGTGLGVVGLANVLSDAGLLAAEPVRSVNPLAPKAPHFPAKAKRIIHLFMGGGPSQVDTFDPKPALEKYNGQKPQEAGLKTERSTGGLLKSPFGFKKCGQSGLDVSEIFPLIGACADDLCVI